MGISFRKTFRAGPIRVTVGRSGVGISAGVRGARVGLSPRGTHVTIGTNGVVWREQLLGAPSRTRTSTPLSASHPPSVAPDPSADPGPSPVHVEHDVAAQLNDAANRVNWGWPVAVGGFLLGCFSGASALFIVWLVAAALSVWLFRRASKRRSVAVTYVALDGAAAWSDGLLGAWRELESASLVAFQQTIPTPSRPRGASPVVRMHATPRLVTNVAVPTVANRDIAVSFLPDGVLVEERRVFRSVPYRALMASASDVLVQETNGLASPDSPVVATTWAHVKRDGTPDRRYRDNPAVRTVRHGSLRLAIGSSDVWTLTCSRPDVTAHVAELLAARAELDRSAHA